MPWPKNSKCFRGFTVETSPLVTVHTLITNNSCHTLITETHGYIIAIYISVTVRPAHKYIIYIIILDPDDRRRRPTTVRSNDTLVDTPFQLISGFFHVSLVFWACWTSFLQGCVGGGGATGLLKKGGGSNRLPGLVNNKLLNFHRYWLVRIIMLSYKPCNTLWVSDRI